jgi:hypothetical protein
VDNDEQSPKDSEVDDDDYDDDQVSEEDNTGLKGSSEAVQKKLQKEVSTQAAVLAMYLKGCIACIFQKDSLCE